MVWTSFAVGNQVPPLYKKRADPPTLHWCPVAIAWVGETYVDLSKLIALKKSTSDPINASKAQSQIQMVAIGVG